MLELTTQNAAEILHARGQLSSVKDVRVRELSGGVSNAVFLIETPSDRFVVKQARGKLRVQADWQCSVERIWREVEVLEATATLLEDWKYRLAIVPQLLWKDQDLYAYAMTAAAPDSRTWKEELMAGVDGREVALSAGWLLGEIHSRSWHSEELAAKFSDRTYFTQLRLEPYYIVAAQQYPRLAGKLSDLVDQTLREQHCLVHGDFSPKNLLNSAAELMLIDFEVGHYGDPAFDIGFCLTHLVLKAIHFPQRRNELLDMARLVSQQAVIAHVRRLTGSPDDWNALGHRSVQHLAGCLVARVHGKSPVDYLTPPKQRRAVQLSENLFGLGPAASWDETYDLLQREV